MSGKQNVQLTITYKNDVFFFLTLESEIPVIIIS